ncbi:MAG: redoxin domain-containing protein [Acidobacteria bacterium]|nr:MAG: redoxin domain-containing protein [Acidobacteriota bacterium]
MPEHGAGTNTRQHGRAGLLLAGEMMPDLALVSATGKLVRISDYRGRRNLVVVFCGNGNSDAVRNCLEQISRNHSEFESEEAQVLAAVQSSGQGAEIFERGGVYPFPLLSDEGGYAHELAGAPATDANRPIVCVVDRFGEIRHVWHDEQPGCIGVDDVLEWVRYINLECPE